MEKVMELAPAKLNLTLDVGEKLPDGYHNITSVMTSATLQDVVMLERGVGEGITLTCSDPTLACDETNLAYRAAMLFFDQTTVECDGLHIHLEKRIPMQAGLGGGSSDAAAVLRGLRKLYAPNMKLRELERIAIRLGSDVPFCVRGVTSMVLGRGEQLIPLSELPPCWYVLCKPSESYSTAEMYQRIDEMKPQRCIDTEGMVKALEEEDMQNVISCVGNLFEDVLPENSEIPAIRRQLTALGARCACMSGSGSAVFGLFTDEKAAHSACQTLIETYPCTYFAESV